jgi:phosphatidylglycerol:prolipoprotein diacylglycerol transferase
MMLALVSGLGFYIFRTRRRGYFDDQILYIAAAAIIGGTLGAKLPGWILHLNLIAATPGELYYSSKTIVGGLLGGTLAVMGIKRLLSIRRRLGNEIAPAAALAMAIGRIGCLLNGCCYGRPTGLPWGIDFGDHIARHPTQLYEALFDMALLFLLLRLERHITRPGLLFGLLLISYFVGRFFIEFIRVEPVIWVGLTAFQLASLAGIIFALGKYFCHHPADPLPLEKQEKIL